MWRGLQCGGAYELTTIVGKFENLVGKFKNSGEFIGVSLKTGEFLYFVIHVIAYLRCFGRFTVVARHALFKRVVAF